MKKITSIVLGIIATLILVGCTSPVSPVAPTPTAVVSPVSDASIVVTATEEPVLEGPTLEFEQIAVTESTPPASAEVFSPPSLERPVETPVAFRRQPESLGAPLSLHPFQPAGGRKRLVALDPGHGGPEVGAAGAGLAEKNVNLAIALKLRKMLEDDGIQVLLTRDGDRRAYIPPDDKLPEGNSATRQDLQARIDIANRAGADVFISIHNNGSVDPSQSGTEVWYDGKRPFGAFNRALGEVVLSSLVVAIRSSGYPVVERGLKEDSQFRTFQGRTFPLFLLGPPRTGSTTTRATQMPAILGETLFLSHPAEAELLKRDDVLTAIAGGYREGLRRYLQRIERGELSIPPAGFPAEKPNYYDLRPPGTPQATRP